MIADCTRRRIPIPPLYLDPPEIGPEFAAFVWAFNELSAERQQSEVTRNPVTVKIYRITRKAMREWAEYHGFVRDLQFMEELAIYVRALDTVWCDVEHKRLRREASK